MKKLILTICLMAGVALGGIETQITTYEQLTTGLLLKVKSLRLKRLLMVCSKVFSGITLVL